MLYLPNENIYHYARAEYTTYHEFQRPKRYIKNNYKLCKILARASILSLCWENKKQDKKQPTKKGVFKRKQIAVIHDLWKLIKIDINTIDKKENTGNAYK